MLILCSLALLQIQASGLNPGETLVELAPVRVSVAEDLRYGRIRDAFTGKPVAGAVIETWTEENDSDLGGPFRLGEATSGQDGRFAVRGIVGNKQAEKVRVRAAGYCTLSATLGDIEFDMVIFPAPTEPTRVQVVDAHDRPISGVLFTSTRTCAHDLPAFSVRSDALGWATMAEYGMQDEVPDLRLRATGFGAIKYLSGDDIFLTGSLPVRLMRRDPISFILLDKQGAPWSGANLMIMDDDGHHVLRTGKDGSCTIASRYGNDELILYVLEKSEQRYLASLPIATDRTLTVRDGAEEWPDEVPLGTLEIDRAQGRPCKIWACHTNGWFEPVSEGEYAGFEFPAGEGFLLVGGPFSGFEREVIPFDLAADGTVQIPVEPAPEPRIRVLTPNRKYSELWVQGPGETINDAPRGEAFPVPGTGEICVIYRSEGEVRRVCIDAATDGQVIDLRPDAAIVQAAAPTPPMGQRTFEVPAGAKLSASSPNGACDVQPTGPDQATVTGPIGTPFLVQWKAEDCVTLWARDQIPTAQSAMVSRPLSTVRSAKLEISAPPGTRFLGFDATDFEAVAPGPLGIVAQMPDGQRIGLRLQLEPGAMRRIELRASQE